MGSSFRTSSFIWTYFQNCLVWAWNLALGQSARNCKYTLFYPIEAKWSLFPLYRQQFPRYRPIFKIAIFGHKIWSLAKVPKAAHILFFYPRGSKLSLFLLYGQRLPTYRPIFKIGHIWVWNLVIVQNYTYTGTLFLSQRVKFELIFTLWAAVSNIWTNFQTCLIWAWNLTIDILTKKKLSVTHWNWMEKKTYQLVHPCLGVQRAASPWRTLGVGSCRTFCSDLVWWWMLSHSAVLRLQRLELTL